MKFKPKRFVVEVKRGTSRASFASADTSADRFSDAEAALFGSANGLEAKPKPSQASIPSKAESPSGRILRSLVEPPPPVVEEPPPPRRGRKPGSKNKPKPQGDAIVLEAERPRRGRKPGSKNKPKPQVPTAFPPALPASQPNSVAAMRSYGFIDDGTIWTAPTAPTAPEPPPVAEQALPVVPPVAASAPPRVRLRDRSSIIKRYVLDIEPRPGQPGAIRARRMARAV